jgi:hypothetical protein
MAGSLGVWQNEGGASARERWEAGSVSRRYLSAVFELVLALLTGTVRTTIEQAIDFNAMTDDAAATMVALGRQGLDGALKTVKGITLALRGDLKGFVVFVPTDMTTGHPVLLS